jgi:hypothetical protein
VAVNSIANIFESLSDEQSVNLFSIIAAQSPHSNDLRAKVALTRKQYYSRISRMIKVGLIKRRQGRLVLTAYGKVVYESQKFLELANNSQWKFKVIDSINLSDGLPEEERRKLLDNLIENKRIKEILMGTFE